jgi:DNA-binding beta-propeller fold protein YncE
MTTEFSIPRSIPAHFAYATFRSHRGSVGTLLSSLLMAAAFATGCGGVAPSVSSSSGGSTSTEPAPAPTSHAGEVYISSQDTSIFVLDGATDETSRVASAIGNISSPLVVDSVHNKIYGLNTQSNSVTALDRASGAATTIRTGQYPVAIALNTATEKVYVANAGPADYDVTVIDGSTDTSSTITLPGPGAPVPLNIVVNQATNKVYVLVDVNPNQHCISVIDGATNVASSPVCLGQANLNSAYALAVNEKTDKIYAALAPNSITVIDGATLETTTLTAGSNPSAIAVNSTTNKIYVADAGDANLTVIDGATNLTKTIAIGGPVTGIAANEATNKIYVGSGYNNTLTIVDENTNATSILQLTSISAVAVNSTTDKVYVLDYAANAIDIFDGAHLGQTQLGACIACNIPTQVPVGVGPIAIAVNEQAGAVL